VDGHRYADAPCTADIYTGCRAGADQYSVARELADSNAYDDPIAHGHVYSDCGTNHDGGHTQRGGRHPDVDPHKHRYCDRVAYHISNGCAGGFFAGSDGEAARSATESIAHGHGYGAAFTDNCLKPYVYADAHRHGDGYALGRIDSDGDRVGLRATPSSPSTPPSPSGRQ